MNVAAASVVVVVGSWWVVVVVNVKFTTLHISIVNASE
jgi:hypothetical protein